MAFRIAASGAGIVELHASVPQPQSQIAPQAVEIGRDRLWSHLVMQAGQHIQSHRLVGRSKNALDRPIGLDIAAGRDDAAHRILQAETVGSRFANFDIGEQAEHRAAPILAAPGIGIVEAFVTGCGRPFGISRIIACQISFAVKSPACTHATGSM